jgi:hypothetical protein
MSWLDKFPGRVFRCEGEKLEEITDNSSAEKKVAAEKPAVADNSDVVIEEFPENINVLLD